MTPRHNYRDKALWRRRLRLQQTPERCARAKAFVRQQWLDPSTRERMLAGLAAARAAYAKRKKA